MSPKKITDADKLEIVELYRQSGDTTASLASRYGVSNSTISRLLKTSIPEAEYDLLIQQKRGAKVSSDEESLVVIAGAVERMRTETANLESDKIDDKPLEEPIAAVLVESATAIERNFSADRLEDSHDRPPEIDLTASIEPQATQSVTPAEDPPREDSDSGATSDTIAVADEKPFDRELEDISPTRDNIVTQLQPASMTEDLSPSKRLVRRRSSARLDDLDPAVADVDIEAKTDLDVSVAENSERFSTSETLPIGNVPTSTVELVPVTRARVSNLPVLRAVPIERDEYFAESAAPPAIEDPIAETDSNLFEDEGEEPEDVNALAAMFGEEIAEGEEDDDDDDEEDWDEEVATVDRSSDRDLLLTGDRSHLQVTPLSQATLPRTCYIVIDKFAELIVRPLKDFAELGQIPGEEIQQRTLPIFDNHRVAKRFSNQRTQRVIKVPDSRVFQKTIQHLRSKGIARLLVDGNIYSLN